MDIIEFGKQYGWLLAVGMYTLKWFFDKGWPQVVKWFNKSQDSAIKAGEEERKAQEDERLWRRDQSARQTIALETIAKSTTLMDARLTTIERVQAEHSDKLAVLVERKTTVTTTTATIPTP